MIKAKENKKVVGSYKNITEAAQAMVSVGKAANVKAATWNIKAAMAGTEGRPSATDKHPIAGQPRMTAYGYNWSSTKR